MAENRRDRDKRFYFSRGQLVLLGGAFTLASIITFLLGVFVGKRIEERRMIKPPEPLVRIPVKPVGQGAFAASNAPGKEELTFYDTLTKSSVAPPVTEEKPTETRASEKPAKSEANEVKTKSKKESAAASSKREAQSGDKTNRAKEKANAVSSADAAGESEAGRSWYVQVNAFPDEGSARIWVDRLQNKGYKAYVTEAHNQGKVWYRVRVGQYNSREEAQRVENILRSKENFPSAFASRR
jgi:cell division septation protein DedD